MDSSTTSPSRAAHPIKSPRRTCAQPSNIAQLTTEETVADVLRDPQCFLGSYLSRGGFVQHPTGHPVEGDDLRQRPGIAKLPREFGRLCEERSGHLTVVRVDEGTAGRQGPHHERRVAEFPCSCQGLLGLFAALGRARKRQ